MQMVLRRKGEPPKAIMNQRRKKGEISEASMDQQRSEEPTVEQSLAFVKEVKETFEDNPEKYNEFVELMLAFKADPENWKIAVKHAIDLFEGHKTLIDGFGIFLPHGYEMPPPKRLKDSKDKELPSASKGVEKSKDKELFSVRAKDAIKLELKIKTIFGEGSHVYQTFLKSCKSMVAGTKKVTEVHEEAKLLFADRSEVLEEFERMLPEFLRS